jgi:hypothetical protein
MKNDTSWVTGGALPTSRLTLNNLINEETGETDRVVFKGLCRRRAMADYGDLSPRALRSSIRYYGNLVDQMACAWRMRHGLPVEMVMVTPYGKQGEHALRSTF